MEMYIKSNVIASCGCNVISCCGVLYVGAEAITANRVEDKVGENKQTNAFHVMT